MKTHSFRTPLSPRGFSLIEMLSFVAILGIICGLAIPALQSTNDYKAFSDRRNAQELASICASAQAAGLNFVVEGDIDATLANILKGGSPDAGPFKGRVFAVRSLDAAAAQAAAKFLRMQGANLLYNFANSNASSGSTAGNQSSGQASGGNPIS